MRLVLTGQKLSGVAWVHYVSKGGNVTSNPDNVYVMKTLSEARQELEYWRQSARDYKWYIEKLPPRVSVSKGLLRTEEVE